jgi:crotonobetainyl-CoA:carnitine CoA-transferase CaiB-like acyl-CoA transferase
VADIFDDPHFRARDMLVEVGDPDLGALALIGIVPKLSRTPGQACWAGRRIGEETGVVLVEIGGLSQVEISRLEAAGVVFRG